jgi:hypothetical protein
MKITLDTEDVKQSVTEFLQNRNVIINGAELGWDIQKPRVGDEEIRIEVTILSKSAVVVDTPEPVQEEEPAPEPEKKKGLFSDIEQ